MSDNYIVVETSVSEATVITTQDNIVVTDQQTTTVVTSGGSQGPQGIQGIQGIQGETGPQGLPGPSAAISTASDVDISTRSNGSLLIYDQTSQKWVAGNTLSAQYMDAGEF